MKDKTYFVSEDLGLILTGNNYFKDFYKDRQIKPPTQQRLKSLRQDLRQSLNGIFTNVEFIKEQEMLTAMQTLSRASDYPLLSLDKIYLNNSNEVCEYVNLTRVKSGDKTLLTTRNEFGLYVPFDREVDRIVASLKNQFGQDRLEVAVIDDVVYSGSAMCMLQDKLAQNNIFLKQVLTAVCVDSAKDMLISRGIEVKPYYIISNCLDEVCERDFYFGVAQSGQNILTEGNSLLKQPYFQPFGNPSESASIPQDKATDFSLSCLDRSVQLWQEIEKSSNKVTTNADIPEDIFNTPPNFEVVQFLQETQQNMVEGGPKLCLTRNFEEEMSK